MAIHVADNVERGRAGWDPNLWEGKPFILTRLQSFLKCRRQFRHTKLWREP